MFSFIESVFAAQKRLTDQPLIGNPNGPSGLAEKIGNFFDFLFGQIPVWIAAVIIFILSFVVAKIVKTAVESRLSSQIDEEHQEILILGGRLSYFGTLAIGITIALKIAGIDLTTIIAAVAFGIGFALRDLLMNFLAGMMILVSRMFTIGDFIKIGATTGKVIEIQSRATVLRTVDGVKVIVPNAKIFTNSVTNYTGNPTRRVVVPLYVAYGTDLDYALNIILEVLNKNPKILKKPKPSVVIKDYGNSSIDLKARFWVARGTHWFRLRSKMIKDFDKAFAKAGIEVPYEIFHIETSTDTAAEGREAQEKYKKGKEKMKSIKMPEVVAEKVSIPIPSVPSNPISPQA